MKSQQFYCPVDGFQQMISGKYKLRVLWHLRDGPLRYGELKKKLNSTEGLSAVTARVLSRELKALVNFDLLERTDFETVPRKVVYGLSSLGQSLVPIITAMHDFGVAHLLREDVLQKAQENR